MNIENINIYNHVKTIFSNIKCTWEYHGSNLEYKIRTYKGFEHIGNIPNVLFENSTNEEIKQVICMKWFFANITDNLIVIETLVLGNNTYWIRTNSTFSGMTLEMKDLFGRNSDNKSDFLEQSEIYTYSKQDIIDIVSATKNLGKLLGLSGYPLNMLRDRNYGNHNPLLLDIAYKGDSTLYLNVYPDNTMYETAKKLYGSSINHKAFWKKELLKDNVKSRLDNPLWKERVSELKLFGYNISGEAYKRDGRETWRSDISMDIISDQELSTVKIEAMLDVLLDSNIEHIIEVNIFKESDTSLIGYGDRATFIEVTTEGRYIQRANSYKFKQLIKE